VKKPTLCFYAFFLFGRAFKNATGLVANGSCKAVEDDRKVKHLQDCRENPQKSFKRVLDKKTLYRVTPRCVSIVTLQAKKGMKENANIEGLLNRFNRSIGEQRIYKVAIAKIKSGIALCRAKDPGNKALAYYADKY